MVPVPFSTGITDSLQRNLDLNYNPYAYLAMYDTAYIHKRRGWCDGIAHYRHITAPSWNGPTGSWSLWGINEYHGQVPGRGDGSDGKHDNRLTLARPGQPNTKPGYVSQAETNVSVRMQGLLDYNAAYQAYTPPSPPSNVDVPKRVTKAQWFAKVKSLRSIFAWSRVDTTPPPPPEPTPVPTVGRRAVPRWRIF
jgi:hypothetical protein